MTAPYEIGMARNVIDNHGIIPSTSRKRQENVIPDRRLATEKSQTARE